MESHLADLKASLSKPLLTWLCQYFMLTYHSARYYSLSVFQKSIFQSCQKRVDFIKNKKKLPRFSSAIS